MTKKHIILLFFLAAWCGLAAYEVPLDKWHINADKYARTPANYLTIGDESARFSGVGTEGIDFFNDVAIPIASGQTATVKMAVSGHGKGWIGVNGYADTAYTHCSEASRDTSFILSEKEVTRTFKFEMTGKGLKALRAKFILMPGAVMNLRSMTINIADKAATPPLNPLVPEASFFPGPMSMARWIWSPCDIRFSYYRKTPMQNAFFRQKIVVDKPLKSAQLMAGFRLPGKVFVNGREIPRDSFTVPPYALRGEKYILTDALKPGENLLAVEIVNNTPDKSCGLIYLGTVDYADGSRGYFASSSQVKAVTDTPQGNWKLLAYNDKAWTQAMEMGDASTGRWIQMGDTIRWFCTEEEQKTYYDTLEKAKQLSPELAARIAAEPMPDARISWENGLPMIQVHKQKSLLPIRRIGLSTVAPYDGYDFICKTRGMGLDLIDLSLSDYYSGNANYWKAEGVYDFSGIELEAGKFLAINPDAYFIVSIGTNVMRQWCLDHPDETIQYGMGEVNIHASEGDELGGRPLRPSPASRLFREEVDRILTALGKYIEGKPWAKRVIGIKYSYGVTAEWEYYGSTKQMPDCGVAMTKAFREFLRKKYGTDDALKQAWKQQDASFETATAPTPDERWGDRHFLRDPGKFRKVLDFYDCMHQEMADFMIFAARRAKEILPGRLFGVYYSYQNAPRPPEGAKTMDEKILASGAVDFCCAPNDYNNETRSGGGTGMTRIRSSILQRFGKLGILEADIRTYIAENGEEVLQQKSPEETLAVIRRDFCNTIFDRSGLQLHQFGGKGPYRGGPDWYNSPEIIEEIRLNMAVQREVRTIPGMRWEQDIAVVSSYNEFGHHGYPVQDLLTNDYVVWWQIYALYSSGYLFDYLDIKDYMLSTHPYKAVVFLAPYSFTADERKALQEKLRKAGSTAVWIYAPGLVTDKGFSDAAMKELTGIELKSDFRKLPMEIKLTKDDSICIADPWHDNKIHLESPRISSVDKQAAVKGRYSDGAAGYVVKKTSGFTSVFIGVPVRSPWHWAQIFVDCGLRKTAEPKVIVRGNSEFLMVHVGTGGVYEIRLPRKAASVTDVFDHHRVLAENTDHIELICDEPRTWLLRMNK